MNKFSKSVSLIVAVLLLAVTLGLQAQAASAKSAGLPYGLSLQNTRADVEQRFGQPRVPYAPQAGWEPGLPDSGSSPDHMHYWAVYKRFGVTIVYNSPSATDQGAVIEAVYFND